jgi:hypothetical protein
MSRSAFSQHATQPPATLLLLLLLQCLKSNAEGAVKDLKLNMNYITKFGQVALSEAVDMVYELGGGRMTTVHF